MIKEWLPLFRLKPHWFIAVAGAIALSPSPRPFYAALLVAFAYLIAINGELVNFVHDYRIDVQNPRMKGYAHISGKIKILTVKKASYAFLIMALAAGTALLKIKPSVLIFIALAVHCAYSYSAPPLRLKRYWWGGTISYTLSTAVILLISASVLGANMTAAGITALAFWLGSLSVWTLTNIPDQEYDRKEGVETAPIRFGAAKCVRAYLPLVLLSSMAAAGTAINSAGTLYAGIPFLLPAGIGIISYSRMRKEVETSISKRTFNMAILPYRYNMALVTLACFLI